MTKQELASLERHLWNSPSLVSALCP